MKQIKLTFVLTVLMSMVGLQAYGIKINGIYYRFDSSTRTATVTNSGGTSSSSYPNSYTTNTVTIPETVYYNSVTYDVTSIDDYAFYQCTNLSSITIPNSVTKIGNWAFNGCSHLATITFSNSLTYIGTLAFDGTSWYNNKSDGLVYAGMVLYKYKGTMPSNTNITIPDVVLGIANCAFDGCSGLKSVTIPNSVKRIGSHAFSDCTSLSSVIIPSGVTCLGAFAFYGCSSLQNVTIRGEISDVEYISSAPSNINGNVFKNCNNNLTVTFNCASICEFCLFNSESVRSIVIGSEVTSIGRDAFTGTAWYNNQANGLVYAGNFAYKYKGTMTSQTNLSIQYGTKGIVDRAFEGCSYLKSVTIPNTVTYIGNWAFWNCYNLKSVTIPSNVTYIGDCAFMNCGLTSVTIPSNVTYIGNSAFTNSEYGEIANITVANGNTVYDSRNNCNAIIHSGTNELIVGCKNTVIPNSVTSIGSSAFDLCYNMTSITIPNSVTSIGNGAFNGCSGLTSINFPASVTSIDDNAFIYCSGLTSITMPNSVTSIGNSAFYGCVNLTSVTVDINTPLAITSNTFSNRANATLYVPAGSKAAYEAANYWKNFKEINEIGKDMSSSDITINPISTVTYNGSAQTPTVTVMDRTTTLVSGTDYTVAYSNNINAGTATVTITGQGNYTGTKSANFTINPKNASNLTINAISAVTYNGSAQTPAVTVRDGSTTLTNGTHYTVAYSNNTNAGTATVTITGMGNYTSTKNANFTINKAPLTITAKSYTITEGDPLPSFECTYSGFQNGETESVLTTLPTITCDATDSETAGEYDITPSGAAATNYSFNYVSGTLTVNAAESVTIAMKTGGGVARSMIAYSSKYALDFTSRPELKAYIACGYNDKKEVLLVHVKVVPPYTGMVIKTSNGIYDGGEYDVPTTTEEYYYANLLVPVVETGTVTPTETIADVEYTNLTIGSLVGGGIGFVRLTSNWTTHNKSYLRIPTALYNSLASARGFGDIGVEFVEGEEATGILNAKRNALENNGNYYDLLGRKVKPIGKGLYIHNGKKVLVK